MLAVYRQNQQIAAAVEVKPLTGGGGTYPGYASERKQAEAQPAIKASTDKPGSVQAVIAKPQTVKAVQAVKAPTDGQALRRIANAALRDKQLQALGQLMLGLQASQAHQEAEQHKRLRLQINNDDALIALLLTL